MQKLIESHPRPRPATYEAGAGIDRKASLLGLFDAMLSARFVWYKLMSGGSRETSLVFGCVAERH
jgi:hypothetical protein